MQDREMKCEKLPGDPLPLSPGVPALAIFLPFVEPEAFFTLCPSSLYHFFFLLLDYQLSEDKGCLSYLSLYFQQTAQRPGGVCWLSFDGQ